MTSEAKWIVRAEAARGLMWIGAVVVMTVIHSFDLSWWGATLATFPVYVLCGLGARWLGGEHPWIRSRE